MGKHGWRQYGWTFFLTVVFFAAILAGGVGWAIVSNGRKIDKAQTALTALCIHRHRLGVNIGRTKQILRHTRGRKFVFAIPRKLIVLQLADDKREYKDDSILDCKE